MTARQRFIGAVVGQFVQPRGLAGWLAGWEMAIRPSNRKRNLWAVELLEVRPTDYALEIGFGPGVAIVSQPRLPGATAETARRTGRVTAQRLRDAGFTGIRTEILNLRPLVVCVLGDVPAPAEGP